MDINRRTVLEQLARASDADREQTTSIPSLAASLGVDEHVLETHLRDLEACHLARVTSDGTARVTITGEELLELDADGVIIVDSASPGSGR